MVRVPNLLLNGKPIIVTDNTISGAAFSPCHNYRYRLSRIWSEDKPKVLFVLLNPSTADAEKDDPTIRRCMNFAKNWGFGGIYVGNLFAYRTSKPDELKSVRKPVGPANDRHLTEMEKLCDKTVLAWGNHGSYLNRDKDVINLFESPFCLTITQQNQPGHPLYLPGHSELQPIPEP